MWIPKGSAHIWREKSRERLGICIWPIADLKTFKMSQWRTTWHLASCVCLFQLEKWKQSDWLTHTDRERLQSHAHALGVVALVLACVRQQRLRCCWRQVWRRWAQLQERRKMVNKEQKDFALLLVQLRTIQVLTWSFGGWCPTKLGYTVPNFWKK